MVLRVLRLDKYYVGAKPGFRVPDIGLAANSVKYGLTGLDSRIFQQSRNRPYLHTTAFHKHIIRQAELPGLDSRPFAYLSVCTDFHRTKFHHK